MAIHSKDTISTKKAYAHGAIVRMKLENFVTYDSLEFSPGPNLNVIIGPNGTGKSTIVCAICLGMTGKPTVLGRAATFSDYVKYGKTKATIEIELNNTDGPNFIVKRNIFKDNKSEWFLNEKVARLKDVEDLVNSLNIQVSNLCQFLPQEKVTEFAKMNQQELLENTEKAVGGLELYNKHIELKDRSRISKDLERELNMVNEHLESKKATNQRLEAQVKNYEEKKKNEDTILWLRRKRACIEYRDKKAEFDAFKANKDAKALELAELNKKFEPLNQRESELDKKITKIKQSLPGKSSQIHEITQNAKKTLQKLDELSQKINEYKTDYTSKETEFRNHKSKLKTLQDNIEALKEQYQSSKEDLDEIKKSEEEIKSKEKNCYKEQNDLQAKEYEIKSRGENLRSELESNLKKIQDMNNIKEEKMRKLRDAGDKCRNTFMALQWIEKNRNKFKGKVYEPMFFLINVKKKEAAKYVEQSIPFTDLVNMFLFEFSEDLSLFMKEVRNGMNLAVNAAVIPDPNKYKLSDYKPPVSINELKDYGFSAYVRDVVEAPEDILLYLCAMLNIHKIPIGDENTQKNISHVMDRISNYGFGRIYTNTQVYQLTKSRYNGKITTSSSQINNGWWLTSSIDQSKLKELEQKNTEIREKLKQVDSQLAEILGQKKKVEKEIDVLRAERNQLNERKLYIQKIESQLKQKQTLLKTLESQNINLVAEAKTRLEKIDQICKQRIKVFNEYNDLAKRLVLHYREKMFALYEDARYRALKMKIENELRAYTQQRQELEPQVQQYEENLQIKREAAKVALDQASRLNGCRLERGLPPEFTQKFATLPQELSLIETEIHQMEAVAQMTHDLDEKVVKDYKAREIEIAQLEKDKEKKSDKLLKHQNDYESIKNDWLDQVETMIKELNEKYSLLFRQLKCSGEISLGRPDNPEEFSKYGVTIKVSFRNNEKLQELTAWQQSGGEKSVSTMLYMIALQEMTKCPFRVVDEINQGMDPVNERKVFDLIVQNSSAKEYAQYFLLTPKLLPDLKFDHKVNVICVFNGPNNLPHTNYNLNKFIQIKKRLDG